MLCTDISAYTSPPGSLLCSFLSIQIEPRLMSLAKAHTRPRKVQMRGPQTPFEGPSTPSADSRHREMWAAVSRGCAAGLGHGAQHCHSQGCWLCSHGLCHRAAAPAGIHERCTRPRCTGDTWAAGNATAPEDRPSHFFPTHIPYHGHVAGRGPRVIGPLWVF